MFSVLEQSRQQECFYASISSYSRSHLIPRASTCHADLAVILTSKGYNIPDLNAHMKRNP